MGEKSTINNETQSKPKNLQNPLNSCHSERSEESTLAKLENEFKQNGGKWEEFRIGDLFELFE
ncbi:hypothetical protein, partial [Campylobacter troglodytis]|uniref:hypothetical protein n=1 Tax=Campylobacter troglodytis TaxID=654363 RepID=UPI001C8D1C85